MQDLGKAPDCSRYPSYPPDVPYLSSLDLLREAWNREDPRAAVLIKAASCVLAYRQKACRPPEAKFTNIARLWNAYLRAKAVECVGDDYCMNPLGSVDVAVFEILVRVARLAETPDHFDSWVDLAGYASCGARCAIPDFGSSDKE